jgi:hypothetical protein
LDGPMPKAFLTILSTPAIASPFARAIRLLPLSSCDKIVGLGRVMAIGAIGYWLLGQPGAWPDLKQRRSTRSVLALPLSHPIRIRWESDRHLILVGPPSPDVVRATFAKQVGQSRLVLANGLRLSCGALTGDSFLNLRAPPALSGC